MEDLADQLRFSIALLVWVVWTELLQENQNGEIWCVTLAQQGITFLRPYYDKIRTLGENILQLNKPKRGKNRPTSIKLREK